MQTVLSHLKSYLLLTDDHETDDSTTMQALQYVLNSDDEQATSFKSLFLWYYEDNYAFSSEAEEQNWVSDLLTEILTYYRKITSPDSAVLNFTNQQSDQNSQANGQNRVRPETFFSRKRQRRPFPLNPSPYAVPHANKKRFIGFDQMYTQVLFSNTKTWKNSAK